MRERIRVEGIDNHSQELYEVKEEQKFVIFQPIHFKQFFIVICMALKSSISIKEIIILILSISISLLVAGLYIN